MAPPMPAHAFAALAATASAVVSSAPDTATSFQSVITSTVPSVFASAVPSTLTTTAPVTETMVQVAPQFEITAAFAGALAGGLVGVRRDFDFVGIATLAVVCGLGGGIIRDVLLQKYGIYALQNQSLLIATLIAAAIAFYFSSAADRLKFPLFVIDALALGLFAALGADKALRAELAIVPAILLGTITAVGGGMLRDVLTDAVPQVLRPGGFYASAAALGSTVYVLSTDWLHVVKSVAAALCILIVLALRFLSRYLGWRTPTPTDLTPVVAQVPRRAWRSGGRALSSVRGSLHVPERESEHPAGEDPSEVDEPRAIHGGSQGDEDF